MKKTIRKVLSGLLILVFLVILNILDRNILDAMYLSALKGGLSFNNVKEAEYTDHVSWNFFVSSGFFSISFEEEYLREGYEIYVAYYDTEPNQLDLGARITLSSNNVIMVDAEYDYNIKHLTWLPLEIKIHKEIGESESEYELLDKAEDVLPYLEEEGVTKATVKEYQHYVLEEIVLKTWAKGNFRFPFHLLRGVKVIDRAWDIPE